MTPRCTSGCTGTSTSTPCSAPCRSPRPGWSRPSVVSSCSCTCPASREPPRAVTWSSAAPGRLWIPRRSDPVGRGGAGRPCIRPPATAARLRALRAPHRKSVGGDWLPLGSTSWAFRLEPFVAGRPSRAGRRGPAVAGRPSRAGRRGPAVAIVVRSVLGRTACRGHQPHHDHHGGTAGGQFLCRCPRAESRGPLVLRHLDEHVDRPSTGPHYGAEAAADVYRAVGELLRAQHSWVVCRFVALVGDVVEHHLGRSLDD